MSTTEVSLKDRTTDSIELYQQAKFSDAEAGFTECVEIARTLVDSPTELAEALSNLSIAYLALAKFPEALDLLVEALSLFPPNSESSDSQILRACLLNNQARVFAELEQLKELEENLLEAIKLVEPIHPVYAAEFHANLLRIGSVVPRWRHKQKHHADEFDRLQALGEKLEVYLDDMAGWRRPGRHWDLAGQASPESLKARSLNNHVKHLHENDTNEKSDYQAILNIDEESKQVSPHLVAHVNLSLAEIAVQSGDFPTAVKYCDDCLRVVSSSYLSTHPANALTLLRIASFSIIGGRFDQSRKILEDAKALVSQTLGVDNPHYARCISAESLLLPLFAAGGKETSGDQLAGLRQSRDIMMRFYSDSNSNVIDLNTFIVKALISANQPDEAENLLTETSRNAQANQFDSIGKQRRCLSMLADLRIKQTRTVEVEGMLKMNESLLEQHAGLPAEDRLRDLDHIGKQYMDAGLFVEGERVYRQCVELSASRSARTRQNAKQHLALCLMRIGKAADAGELLGSIGDNAGDSKKLSRREELVAQSHLAWSLQTKRRLAQAKALAIEVVNEAHLLMPDCEESLVIALSVLMEQAKSEDQPDEMLRLISMLSGYDSSIRLRAIMPVLYLEAAQLYAKQKSIKAEGLFEKAVKYAENVHAIIPHCLDGCVLAYMNYCAANRKNESALQLCERLIALRTANSGTKSLEYAVAITAKARLLTESDPNLADELSLEAYNILNSMTDPTTKLQLLITVSVREGILKKLLKFDESAKMAARSVELRAELDSQIAALKAGRELQK
jgi:tetratricopeptide (TPR) repeat protein